VRVQEYFLPTWSFGGRLPQPGAEFVDGRGSIEIATEMNYV